MTQGPNILIGPPAWGGDFYDRKDIIKKCWDTLEKSSLILSAPRRYGKSSIMLFLRDNPKEGYFPIYFQLEDHFTLKGFIYELVTQIIDKDDSVKKKLKKWFSKAFGGVEELSVFDIKIKLKKLINEEGDWEEWKERIQQLMMDLLRTKKTGKLLFILDEFPLMLSNFISEGKTGEQEAVKALQWLRKLRHESPFLESTRFILGGSIGIEKVVSYLKATRAINDVPKIVVGPFEREVARRFIKILFKSKRVHVEDDDLEAVLKIAGTLIPIYLHIIVDSVIKESKTSKKPVTPRLVKHCYEHRVHGAEYKHYFEDYYERLCRHYRTEDKLKSAEQILKELAKAEDCVSFDTLFSIYLEKMGNKGDVEKFKLLLMALESDFYIEFDELSQKVCFRNKWLKDWWRIYHGY